MNELYIKLLQFLVTKSGGVVAFFVSMVVSLAFAYMGQKVPFLAEFLKENFALVVTSLSTTIMGAFNIIINEIMAGNVKVLQNIINFVSHKKIEVDGVPEKETIQALKDLVEKVK